MIAREPLAQSQPHVLQIAARAVQQHDRDTTVLRAKFKNVQAPAVNLHQAAGRRMLPLERSIQGMPSPRRIDSCSHSGDAHCSRVSGKTKPSRLASL